MHLRFDSDVMNVALTIGVLILIAGVFPRIEAAETSSKAEEARQRGFDVAVSVIVISLVVIAGVAVIVGICYFVTERMHKEFDAPLPDQLILLKDEEHTMDTATLREKTRTIVSYMPGGVYHGAYRECDQAAIDKLLGGISDTRTEAKEAQSGEIETIVGARDDGTLPIKKHYRLHFIERTTDLHITKMEDFYGNRILLAMAPLRKQFIDQWETIWRRGIGVIVWIGSLMDKNGASNMDPYIGLSENDLVHFGPFTIRTVFVNRRFQEHDSYCVIVKRSGRSATLRVTIFHSTSWPQESVSHSLQRYVHLLTDIKNEHAKQIAFQMPVVLFQCKYGTAGSASLLATYIGYQAWSRNGRVNLNGILQYVRRRRWMAFEQTGDKNHTFLTQVQAAYSIMSAVAEWLEVGQAVDCEQMIKGIVAAQTSMSESLSVKEEAPPQMNTPDGIQKTA